MSNMKKFVLFFLLLGASIARHECVHDKMDIKLDFIDDSSPESGESSSEDRKLATYSNIRIYVDFTYLTDGNSVVREYIKNQLMATAVAYYQNTLSVVPVSANLRFTQSCGGLNPPTYLQITGVAADLVIMVTAEYSSDSYLAYAIPCSLATSNKRPVYGMINFNLRTMYTAADTDLQENLITTLHEMVHVFGFSSSLYQYYIDPATNTNIKATGSTTVNGITTNYINVSPLTAKLQDYFDCSTLEGGYLENQGDSGSAGSHWERKTFANEYMTASSITDAVITPFTLALLQGSGWYQVVYANAEPYVWGQKKKCPFVKSPCMSSQTPSATPEFCATLQQEGCTFTNRAVGICGTTNALTTDRTLISQFNYWSNYTTVLDEFADNCPYVIGYPNLDCENPANKANAVLSQETYGVGSRCFSGTLTTKASPRARTGYCFPTKCVTSSGTTTVQVTVGTNTVTCSAAGTLSVGGLTGQIECPNPATFCASSNPVYCRRGCSGRGTCTNNVCVCPLGWGGIDCGFRIYVDSCMRCASTKGSTSCFGDGCSCNPDTATCTGPKLIGVGDGGVSRPNDGSSAVLLNIKHIYGFIAAFVMFVLTVC